MASIEKDIVDLCVWAYAEQRAHVIRRRLETDGDSEMRMLTRGRDSIAKVEDRAALGCRIDGGGPSSMAIHDDAWALDAIARERLTGLQYSLIIENALSGGAPDPMIGLVSKPKPLIGRNGKPMDYDGRDLARWKSKRTKDWRYARASRVIYRPSPETIENAREMWTMWHAAITALCVELEGQMASHRATGPDMGRFPLRPWSKKI